jgi:hypothetical protein
MVWSKKLPKSKTWPTGALAVFIMNNGDSATDISADLSGFAGCKSGSGCAVRDVWNHKSLPSWQGGAYTVKGLGSRDSHFATISYAV